MIATVEQNEKEAKFADTLDSRLVPNAGELIGLFTGNSATYEELQKVLLIFKIFNLDNDLGQAVLDAVENDWKSREPDDGCPTPAYIDGLMTAIDMCDLVDDYHRDRGQKFRDNTQKSINRKTDFSRG